AADDHAVIGIAKGNRENAGRGGASKDGRLAHRPVAASILGMEDSRRFSSSRTEPKVLRAVRDEAGAAGREGALVRQSRRQVGPRKPLPMRAAVLGDDQGKFSLDRVAESHAVLVVP